MNTSQSRFAKMPAAPPSPPTLPRQSFASLGSPTEETGEAWSRPAWTRGTSAEERAWARYGQENALPASPAQVPVARPERIVAKTHGRAERRPRRTRGRRPCVGRNERRGLLTSISSLPPDRLFHSISLPRSTIAPRTLSALLMT